MLLLQDHQHNVLVVDEHRVLLLSAFGCNIALFHAQVQAVQAEAELLFVRQVFQLFREA